MYQAKIGDLRTHCDDRPAQADKSPAAGNKTTEFHSQVNVIHNVNKQVVLPRYGKNIRQVFENVLQYLRLAAARRQVNPIAVFVFAHKINMPVLIGLLAVKKR